MSTQDENPLVKVLKKSVGISSGGCCGPKVAAEASAADADKAGAQPSEEQAEGACCGEEQKQQAECCG